MQGGRFNEQLEKGIGNLQHENMRVIVLMTDENALTRPSHAILLVMFLESLQSGKNRGVFFGLCLFCAKGVVAERVQTNSPGLVSIEVKWLDRSGRAD